MNIWIVGLGLENRVCYVSWIWKRPMTMLIGTFFFIYWGGVGLGRDGALRSSTAFRLSAFQF
jgi:hypothetical protein